MSSAFPPQSSHKGRFLSVKGGGGVTGKRKMEGTAVVSLTWLFIFVKPYCYVSLVVQSNLHTLVVLSFTEGFRTIFRLREKELEKNWTDQQNWAMNLNHLCKETFWFLTMENQKTVCIFRFQNILPHQSNSPTKTWRRQRHEIFWRQRLCWLVKYVNTNLPWYQFLTLVIQGFKTLVVKEFFSQHNLFFLCFQWCFHWWRRLYCVNWSLVFPGAESKIELGFNKIQY